MNFKINKVNGEISSAFFNRGISDFVSAAQMISSLKYKRNINKADNLCVLNDLGGTCSTKHAVLKRLADENNFYELKLILGIYRMNAQNTPPIKNVLEKYELLYIPEAHNYLIYQGQKIDYTHAVSKPESFEQDLLTEIEITPNQITDFKINFHKEYLTNWLINQKNHYTLNQLWEIREECIRNLSDAW
ncbi:hypothetical protein [Elizabethkingia meningoseptica]|uniref:hypothetical protein n=1 Tax=Elizabethkingia meningoseptica TaxID=238 RepID=UPI003017AB20